MLLLLWCHVVLFVKCHSHRQEETDTAAHNLKRSEAEFEDEYINKEGNADAKVAQNAHCCWIGPLICKSVQQLANIVEDGDWSH